MCMGTWAQIYWWNPGFKKRLNDISIRTSAGSLTYAFISRDIIAFQHLLNALGCIQWSSLSGDPSNSLIRSSLAHSHALMYAWVEWGKRGKVSALRRTTLVRDQFVHCHLSKHWSLGTLLNSTPVELIVSSSTTDPQSMATINKMLIQ